MVVTAGSMVQRASVALLCHCVTVHMTLHLSEPQSHYLHNGSTSVCLSELFSGLNLKKKS